ncbi:MAG: diacylglycerol/lipid kinase family protein [Actinomycetota bacterium]
MNGICSSLRFGRALVIYNPTAGARRRRRMQAVLDGLARHGCRTALLRTERRGDAEDGARTAGRDGFDLVVAAGGDGTVNEVANGLAASDAPVPMAFLPLGTANVLAAEIGLAPTPAAVVAMIEAGRTRSIRLGLAEGRHFVLMASAGLDSAVVQGVDLALKRATGKLAYGIEAVRQALAWPFPELTATIDGVDHAARMVVVCKARCYGGPFLAAPQADLSDDRLQVVLLQGRGLGALARYGAALAAGRLALQPDVRIIAAHRLRLAGPAPLQADGDLVGMLPVDISVSDRTIDLVVP